MRNILFKIQSKTYRTVANIFNYRPTSYPYITGDGFRAMADHIFDETKKCIADNIKNGDVVFLKSDMIDKWFKEIHPYINTRYKLITHNSDACVGEKESGHIDNKIIRWFAQNNTFKHEKITPIPIGIENKHWYMSGWTLIRMIDQLREKSNTRKNRIIFGFNVNTNPDLRNKVLKELRFNPLADEITTSLRYQGYFQLLNQYNYVASPEGNGVDCHRTWEALYLEVVPIVTKSVGINYFKSLGLPLQITDNWSNIELQNKTKLFDSPALYLDFWKDMIVNSN